MLYRAYLAAATVLAFSAQPTLARATPSFGAGVDYGAGAAAVTAALPGDLDGDGHADLVVAARDANGVTVRVLLATASGALQPAGEYALPAGPGYLAVGDFTGDGRIDAVVDAAGLRLLPGNGDGTFGTAILSPGYGRDMFAADFNGDGRLDIVSIGENSTFVVPDTVDVYFGNGDGTFGPFQTVYVTDLHPAAPAAADFDGDGDADLVFGLRDTRFVQLMRNDGGGTFTQVGSLFTEVGPNDLALADLDGDGNADIVSANFTPTVSVFRGHGDGTFDDATIDPATGCTGTSCPVPQSIALADVDADGSLDVVTANQPPGSVSVFLNDGSGALATRLVLGTHLYARFVAAVDLDRNGSIDLAVTTSDSDAATPGPRFATVFLQTAGNPDDGLQPVTWTGAINASVENGVLRKTGGCDGCYDAGASAAEAIESGPALVQFAVVDPTRQLTAGLTATGATTPTDLQFGLRIQGSGRVEVRESGIYRADLAIAAGDVLRIAVGADAVVTYARNGTVFFTSSQTPAGPLAFVVLLASANAAVADARIGSADGGEPPPPPPPPDGGPVAWTEPQNVSIAAGVVTKTAGCNGCFDARVASDQTIDGDAIIEFRIPDTSSVLAVGLAPAGAVALPDLDFGLLLQGGGWMEVREGGSYRSDVLAQSGDTFGIIVTAGVVRYAHNGTVFYTSSAVPAFPLSLVGLLATDGASFSDATIDQAANAP